MIGSLFALAIGLSMDAVAVAAARGLSAPAVRPGQALRIGVLFGAFQAGMPAVGYLLGTGAGRWIERWDHWIALVLLGGLGVKMILEGVKHDDDEVVPDDGTAFGWAALLPLAVATSIDALAAGFTLPLLGWPLGASLATIGVTTAVLSYAGVYAGRRFGAHLGPRLDVLGGCILIAIGVKIVVEHTLPSW